MVSRTVKTIKMKEKTEKEKPCKKDEEELQYCEQCYEDLPEEHICLTCCGDEITGMVEDIGLCPTCLEHI